MDPLKAWSTGILKLHNGQAATTLTAAERAAVIQFGGASLLTRQSTARAALNRKWLTSDMLHHTTPTPLKRRP